ncbi:hypothetical protein M8J75_004812 [Diaphorina citri]|nr:hypothetical protein M8J75_004812 [Diaphorina citri]
MDRFSSFSFSKGKNSTTGILRNSGGHGTMYRTLGVTIPSTELWGSRIHLQNPGGRSTVYKTLEFIYRTLTPAVPPFFGYRV